MHGVVSDEENKVNYSRLCSGSIRSAVTTWSAVGTL